MNRQRGKFLVANLLGDGAARFGERRSGIHISLGPEHQAQAGERPGAVCVWSLERIRQRPFKPHLSVPQKPSMMPEDRQRPGKAKHAFGVSTFLHPGKRGQKVGVIGLDAAQSNIETLIRFEMVWFELAVECAEIVGMTIPGAPDLTLSVQLLQPEFANCFEHGESGRPAGTTAGAKKTMRF